MWNVTKNNAYRADKHFTPGMFNILFALFNRVWNASECPELDKRATELRCHPFSQACRINLNKEMDAELFAKLPKLLGFSPVGSADIAALNSNFLLRQQVFARLIYNALEAKD